MRRFVQAFAADIMPGGLPPAIIGELAAVPVRYNIAVRKTAVVILDRGAGLCVEDFAWGLVPSWSPLPETKYTTMTARLDRAARSRIFRRPWEQRRCVVPMNGYYKWDRTASRPRPYFIQSQTGQALFAAGLWDHWHKAEPELYSFAVLTHANPAIPAPLVPDGPVFLAAADVADWIAGPRFPMRFLSRAAQPRLEAYPVSRRIRSPDVDDYTLLEPVDAREDDSIAAGLDHALDEEDE